VREAEHAEIVDVEVAEGLDREIVLRLVELDEAVEDAERLPHVLERLLRLEASGAEGNEHGGPPRTAPPSASSE
jgi:hypothetical protein